MESWYVPFQCLSGWGSPLSCPTIGFMKHLPNLLKQESSSASCLINVSLRMYYDKRPEYQAQHAQVADRLMP